MGPTGRGLEDRASLHTQRWRQLLFFEALLIGGISLYWVAYLVLIMTILRDWPDAPLALYGVMLALHLFVLKILWLRPAERRRACILGVALVADSVCLALLHPQFQDLWPRVLGISSGSCFEEVNSGACDAIGRVNGILIYQCFLVYHTLLLLQGSSSMLSSMASIVVYFGILLLGGATVEIFDVAAVVLLVSFSLIARRKSDELFRQMDILFEELENRTLSSSEESGADKGANLEEPGEPEDMEATSSSFRPDATVTFDLSSSATLLNTSAELTSCKEAAMQTSFDNIMGRMRGPTCDSSAQTSLAWHQGDGCRCTRCSKPPLPPRSDVEAERRNRYSRRGADSSDSEGSHSGGESSLRFPSLQKTPRASQHLLLLSCIFGWNFKVRRRACCPLHAATVELQKCALQLHSMTCQEEPFAVAYQCMQCGACTEKGTDHCAWCRSERMSPPQRLKMSKTSPESL